MIASLLIKYAAPYIVDAITSKLVKSKKTKATSVDKNKLESFLSFSFKSLKKKPFKKAIMAILIKFLTLGLARKYLIAIIKSSKTKIDDKYILPFLK